MLQLSHKKLDVYKITLLFIKEIYAITKSFPETEKFGLITQVRRASISVCSNIAEGLSRKTALEQRRFLEIARSSLVEIDTQLEISLMLNYVIKENVVEVENYISRIFQMLSKMIKNLDTK